jgi:hypothetical protein
MMNNRKVTVTMRRWIISVVVVSRPRLIVRQAIFKRGRARSLSKSGEPREAAISGHRTSVVVQHNYLASLEDEGPFTPDARVALASSIERIAQPRGAYDEFVAS